MTRERYESLKLTDLREIAEARGMKGISALRKAQLVDAMLVQDEKDARANLKAREEKKEERGGNAKQEEKKQEMNAPRDPSAAGQTSPTSPASSAADADNGAAADRGTGKEDRRQPADRQNRRKQTRDNNSGHLKNGNRNNNYSQNSGQKRYPKRNGKAEAADNAPEKTRQSAENAESQSDKENQTPVKAPEPQNPAFQAESRPAQNSSSQSAALSYAQSSYPYRGVRPDTPILHKDELNAELDSGQMANGILEVMQEGNFGFIRSFNYLPGDNDVYVAPSQIRRFNLKTGDMITGHIRVRTPGEKFSALLYVKSVNGFAPEEATKRYEFETMTPVFPDDRIRLEKPGASLAMRIMDLMCPIGKGQRGMIVSPPKAGKTTLLKEVAKSVKANNPDIHLIILLIDERPEEVTDIREAIQGPNIEVIYSTFDETPDHHKRVAEMVIERAKRLVEHKEDVMILLDSITRLTRAYNLTEPSSGRTLSGGLDPAALHMPKRFFGAARNMREGGSLTILATALIETGSKMDDVVYEEFKGTGNMEMVLDRKLSERRIFPAIDIQKSGTRRDDLLLTPDELGNINTLRRALNSMKSDEAVNQILDLFSKTRTNGEFVNMVRKFNWQY